ncbi:hypothetical protein R3W88_020811 [Solanum pinnatisectum]|uniref:Uncharacterized protein n=1 Tax=Solanum pinnatisectum TaxID=50273 RepID=A0AAV9KQN8_9SOLN|nr:hypothetical protein R3W88_020811 [Solanum pinnatisectum]
MATEADLIVILRRSIGISTYQGLSLQTRFNSTIRVDPNYPQAVELINWAKENKTMLLSRASEKTSTSSFAPPMVVTPAGQQVISIAKISSPASLRKSSWGSSNNTHATLSILSYMKKEHTPQSTADRNSKKIRPLEISEVEVMATTTATGSSNALPKFEPPTPTKKV